MRKARVVQAEELRFENGYEPPLTAQRGICSDTVEDPMMTITRVLLPPGGRSQRHYHVNCDTGMHVLEGRLKFFFGPDHNMEEIIVEAGDFVFISQGEIYGILNLSDSEPAEWITNKAIVSNIDKEGTVFIEPPWGK